MPKSRKSINHSFESPYTPKTKTSPEKGPFYPHSKISCWDSDIPCPPLQGSIYFVVLAFVFYFKLSNNGSTMRKPVDYCILLNLILLDVMPSKLNAKKLKSKIESNRKLTICFQWNKVVPDHCDWLMLE